MEVTVDQAMCTSSGLCEVIAPDVFEIREDGLAHLVTEGPAAPGASLYTCTVMEGREDAVREAAEQCPGECIYIRE